MHRLFKSQRIRKWSEFEEFRLPGVRRVHGGVLLLKSLVRATGAPRGGTVRPRIALITSRKIGNAATRNRIRRVMREAFRLNGALFDPVRDYLLIALPGIADKANGEVTAIILRSAKKINAAETRTGA
jgi:ribonuclease P protein component